ncbi:MAG: FAD binding domain-containing protein [Acidobacteriota bacterium]
MLRLPTFRYHAPKSSSEVAAILHGEGPAASVLAGGTDLFPNMKRRQQTPRTVVSLRNVVDLHRMDGSGGTDVGAAVTLAEVVTRLRSERRGLDALYRAAAQVATPHLRSTATLGGNICLDTRCSYYDQTYEWRQAIGFCMKREGEVCWVAPSSRTCLAVSSTDCAPALIAHRTEVTLLSVRGERRVALTDLYANDGIAYLTKQPDELLTAVHIPGASGWRSTYWKLRQRGSIDFPVLGVAAALRFAGDDPTAPLEDARIVLGAVSSRPLVVPTAELLGRPVTDDAIEAIAERASLQAKPVDNADFTIVWRKAIVKTFVTGTLRKLRGDPAETLGLLARKADAAVS